MLIGGSSVADWIRLRLGKYGATDHALSNLHIVVSAPRRTADVDLRPLVARAVPCQDASVGLLDHSTSLPLEIDRMVWALGGWGICFGFGRRESRRVPSEEVRVRLFQINSAENHRRSIGLIKEIVEGE